MITNLKSLNEYENKLEAEYESIQLQIEKRNQIKDQIDQIDNAQELNELMLDISPAHRSSPLSKIVTKHTEINAEAIKLLKANYLAMEINIMNNIDNYNKCVNQYNDAVASAHIDLLTMDADDKLALQKPSGEYYFYSQNESNEKARFKFSIDGQDFRFGIAPNSDYKSTVVTLNYQQQIDQINMSWDQMGISPDGLFKQFPAYKKLHEKLTKNFRKDFRKVIK